MRTEIAPAAEAAAPSNGITSEFDIVIVGAGFSGCYLLHRLRERGFRVCVIEAAAGLGGVWQWNCYPGARVDTHAPLYQYSIPEVWKTWNWSQRYPASSELLAYFEHVDKVLRLSKDVVFNTTVRQAEFDKSTKKWIISTHGGSKYTASFFIPAMGFAAKRSFPNWPGVENFKGDIHHSSFWPREGVPVGGKKVAVVGSGSTGVQLVQEMGKQVGSGNLTLFQRTPNLALPLRQLNLTPEMQDADRPNWPSKFAYRLMCDGGYDFSAHDINTFEHSPEEREKFFEDKWERGGFLFWSGAYKDQITDRKANRAAYDFWASKIRTMIDDPVKRDILAPLEPPHPFGTKRCALFADYYDVLNRDNINVVDIKRNPVEKVVENGLITADGNLHELDVIALATGFDAITGSLKAITVKGLSGQTLNEKWSSGTKTHLGLMTADFPNMFFTYGPQAPTAFANGPACIEMQADWIADVLTYLREAGIATISANPTDEEKYTQLIHDITSQTLWAEADSYYMGANVQGKVREMLNWPGGVPAYLRLLTESANNKYSGFDLGAI
ncbi:hypothetical protein AJ79_02540 [Helicocarpus griseus UAMH5409]|uniref:FAD/NAD(P)-binding domain-containing protein n=1 Tax=Helicocarpus griseus UAMH5409 TaxID=1447875 RepID=A0A2B7Y1V5_9EURO|nr:hypothetical protein AJ79_02540 [Helicocarpus griseus UAMH5409]